MPRGYVGYNQASDMGNAFGGVGDILGSAILRGAMMRQQQQDRQQQLMIEIERLRQEQENAQSLKEYRGEEIGFRKKEGEREDTRLGFARQKAEEGAAETAMRKRFATSQRTEGIGPLMQGPTQGGGNLGDEQARQMDAQESAAFLSNDPGKGLETVLKMGAARRLGTGNPVLDQMLLTGQGLHNIPTGAAAVAPAGGPPVSMGPARPSVGADASVNSIANLLARRIGTAASIPEAMKDPNTAMMEQFIMNAVRKQMGTNAPPATTGQPITAVNPQTKQRIVSYDNGQTWQPAQ
jgi:hypothetical protein